MSDTSEVIDPLFHHGEFYGTPGALGLLANHGISPLSLLVRHITGDWGDVDPRDIEPEDIALFNVADGDRRHLGLRDRVATPFIQWHSSYPLTVSQERAGPTSGRSRPPESRANPVRVDSCP